MSGLGYNGTLTTSSIYSLGSNLYFSGNSTQSALVPYTIQNQITNQLTISSWINAAWFNTGNNDGVAIVDKCMPSLTSPFTIYGMYVSPSGNYVFAVGNGSTRTVLNSNTILSLNTWYNLVGTYDGTNLSLYMNGVKDTGTATGTYTIGQNTVPTSIGANQNLTGYEDAFKGYINNVMIYNRALSASEVKQNFNAHRQRFGV
jgi:hypothetical protein